MSVHYDVDGAIVVITADRPAVANAIDRRLSQPLIAAVEGHAVAGGLDRYAAGAWRRAEATR